MIRAAIVLLAIATASIHLYWSTQTGVGAPLMVLNGLGYLGLVTALYAPLPALKRYRSTIRWVLLGYTALTVVLWTLVGPRIAIAYADKVIELALIASLWLDGRAARRAAA